MAMTRAAHAFPGRDPMELSTTSKGKTAGAGFEIVEQRRPSFLLDGSPASVRGHGLVAVTGCAALDEFPPDFLVPAHCTGRRATHALAARFHGAFVPNGVGTPYEFAASDA